MNCTSRTLFFLDIIIIIFFQGPISLQNEHAQLILTIFYGIYAF